MAAITVTAAQVEPVFPNDSSTVIRNYQCLTAVTAGNAVYSDPTTGQGGVADASVSGKEQFRGIALSTRAIGDTVRVQERGEIAGFDLSALNFDALVYLDAAGALATVANGSKTVQAGRVKALTTMAGPTKVLYVAGDLLRNW